MIVLCHSHLVVLTLALYVYNLSSMNPVRALRISSHLLLLARVMMPGKPLVVSGEGQKTVYSPNRQHVVLCASRTAMWL